MTRRRSRPVLAHAVVDAGGKKEKRLLVFCPRQERTLDLGACRRCPAFVAVEGDSAGDENVKCCPEVVPSRFEGQTTVAGAMAHALTVCVREDVPFGTVRTLIEARELPFVLVVDGSDHVVGMVWAGGTKPSVPPSTPVGDVMSAPRSADETTSLHDVLVRMAAAHLRSLPIVAQDGTPVGIVRDVDVLLEWAKHRNDHRGG